MQHFFMYFYSGQRKREYKRAEEILRNSTLSLQYFFSTLDDSKSRAFQRSFEACTEGTSWAKEIDREKQSVREGKESDGATCGREPEEARRTRFRRRTS